MNNDSRAALLGAHDVSKTYPDGQVHALTQVTFTVDRGEYVAIMGPSGSGKSTLLHLLGALDLPDSGEVRFENQPLAVWGSLDRFRSQKIGFVFQAFYLLPTLTALENVQLPMFEGRLSRARREARAEELLDFVGLASRRHHRPGQLSVGQRQRVAVARALANDPPIVLADEPTGNLDSDTAAELLDLFQRLRQERGLTLVLITHSAEVARQADRIVVLRDGRIDAS